LAARTTQLLQDNVQQVLQILTGVSSNLGVSDPQLMKCITSWSSEIPAADIVNSSLLSQIFGALEIESSFEAAVECLCTLFRETKDVDSSTSVIQTLFPRVIALRPRIAQAAESDDEEIYRGLTKIFAEAGEAWVVLVARMPNQFRPLVEAVLECAMRDKKHEAISLTFSFWYEIRSYLTLDRYIEARAQYADLVSTLVDIMIRHLEYPIPEDDEELFDGDKDAEEKFREFRHNMGDVLKDCCEIIGSAECLGKSYALMQKWVADHPGPYSGTVPEWQKLEAPIFSMRAMGKMVSKKENIILPQAMPLLLQLPEHEKIRFAITLSLGRYTEWTAEHPETLEPQLNYIIAGFSNSSEEVLRAAAMALKHFCIDCKHLLGSHAAQLQHFYEQISSKLQADSLEEATEGVASVVSVQPIDKIYDMLKLYCGPIVQRLMAQANVAVDKESKYALAGMIVYINVFNLIAKLT
jgi:transportin-3